MSEHDDHGADNTIEHKHAAAHIELLGQLRDLNGVLGALTDAGRAQLDTIEALEFRIVVLEGRMENVLARLDGHDLGSVTIHLDAEGRDALAKMLRRQDWLGPDDPHLLEKKGTSRS